ncbi:MAG: glycosyltransferase family 4 protein [Candidatus Acidiferrales bacterium]
MHVLCLTQWFSPEPESSRGLPFAKWLQAQGHRVTVLTGFPNYPSGKLYAGYRLKLRQWEEIEGIRVLRVPLYPNHDRSAMKRGLNYLSFAAAAALIGLPSVGKVDVIYVMATPPTAGLPPLVTRLFSGVPYLFNVTDIWPEAVMDSGMVKGGLCSRVMRGSIERLCRFVYGQACFVTAISHRCKRLLIERGLREEQVHAVYNWVDEDLFRPLPRDPDVMRRLGIEGRFNIVYAGNFGPFQDLHTVIRAAALVRHIPEIQIVLVGTGQLEEEVRAHAAELGLGNVRFIPRVEQRAMPAIYSAADVLLVHLIDRPFLRDILPSKIQMSLATGRPVLMAAAGESAEVIREARAGLTCEPENERMLAACMEQLYRARPGEREEMSKQGRKYYLERMSQEVGARAIEALFERAIA